MIFFRHDVDLTELLLAPPEKLLRNQPYSQKTIFSVQRTISYRIGTIFIFGQFRVKSRLPVRAQWHFCISCYSGEILSISVQLFSWETPLKHNWNNNKISSQAWTKTKTKGLNIFYVFLRTLQGKGPSDNDVIVSILNLGICNNDNNFIILRICSYK